MNRKSCAPGNAVFTGTAVFVAFFMSTSALAGDPPQRVGRISYLDGTVSFHAAEENDWSYATLNYPVVSGNTFWTEPESRSEIQIGAVEIRMDHSTEMQVSQLDENTTRLDVPQGVVNIHFAVPPLNGSVEVITPSGPVELTQPGTYHIDSGTPGPDGSMSGPVQVTALEGQLSIQGPRSLLEVMPGETAILTGNPPNFSLQEATPTPFDDWALARERREAAHYATQYVSPHVTGYEDLDNYGQWSQEPEYGNVWYPTQVDADWAPYRYGHWAYVAPWGWTWVDNAPWGFAPFHYGRWAQFHGRWGWTPGAVVERPVYAPALVAFVGGAGWNISISTGSSPAVGWIPLGPREVFHPYYPTSVAYARNVNMMNVDRHDINNITVNNYRNVTVNNYVNQHAAVVVPAETFQRGEPVHKAVLRVSPAQLQQAHVTPTLAHLAPSTSAREEGHAISHASEASIPHTEPMAEQKHVIPAAQQNTPSPAHESPAFQEPHVSHEAQPAREPQPVHESAPIVAYHNPAVASSGQHEGASAQEHAAYAHAPGPVIRQHAPSPQTTPHEARPNLPKADMPHPQQHDRITPTHEGWKRMPQLPQQHQPQQQPSPHPEQHGEEEHKGH